MSDSDEIDSIRERKREELRQRVAGGADPAADPEPETTPDSADAGTPDEPIHVEGADHLDEITSAHRVVLVDFYADWCGPCQMLEPIVRELARDTDAAVAKVDVDRHQTLAGQAQVQGVPTLFLYVDGEPAQRMVGMQDAGTLRDLIEGHAG